MLTMNNLKPYKMKKLKHKLEILEERLQEFDWNYQYSDDYRVYQRGSNQSRVINKLMRELTELGYEKDADKLYEQYLNMK